MSKRLNDSTHWKYSKSLRTVDYTAMLRPRSSVHPMSCAPNRSHPRYEEPLTCKWQAVFATNY